MYCKNVVGSLTVILPIYAERNTKHFSNLNTHSIFVRANVTIISCLLQCFDDCRLPAYTYPIPLQLLILPPTIIATNIPPTVQPVLMEVLRVRPENPVWYDHSSKVALASSQFWNAAYYFNQQISLPS